MKVEYFLSKKNVPLNYSCRYKNWLNTFKITILCTKRTTIKDNKNSIQKVYFDFKMLQKRCKK